MNTTPYAEDQPMTKSLLAVSSALDGIGKVYMTGVCAVYDQWALIYLMIQWNSGMYKQIFIILFTHTGAFAKHEPILSHISRLVWERAYADISLSDELRNLRFGVRQTVSNNV